ncbi:MAG: hypothetical protein C4K58_06775 [Flavobacteriaceae bacterium]|nr:MAG: hypothetical protein C4K58_06775 [Flavobacteriaceae bacterium]
MRDFIYLKDLPLDLQQKVFARYGHPCEVGKTDSLMADKKYSETDIPAKIFEVSKKRESPRMGGNKG